ncbi:hypothetical protein [Leucobacter chinensis]|uniref:hypothetical protein n=1 Tax=Leucobacter chinensis TaxID=2851010 RepID=UPI001C222BBD|nr:hypothetical protein [Leucobacter chinensis]
MKRDPTFLSIQRLKEGKRSGAACFAVVALASRPLSSVSTKAMTGWLLIESLVSVILPTHRREGGSKARLYTVPNGQNHDVQGEEWR